MNLQEMATIVQEGLPIKMCILNNGYLGLVRQWQELFYQSNYSGSPIFGPDFAKLAEAYSIRGLTIKKSCDVKGAVAEAMAHDGPILIDFQIEREQNVFPIVPVGQPIHNMIRRPVCK
jgi:acetolactate synthase-1/2/3 large subunit